MPSSKFETVTVQDKDLQTVQRNIRDFADQLEDQRRGLLVAGTVQVATNYQVTEELFVEYVGVTAGRITLPAAALRGPSRSQGVFVANGSIGSITVLAAGSELVSGASSITLTSGTGAWLFSNGSSTAGRWYRAA